MSADALIGRIVGKDSALVVGDNEGNEYRFVPSGDTFAVTKNGSTYGGLKVPTAAKTAAYTCTVADCGTVFTNRGATAMVRFTLPTATGNSGLFYDFIAVAGYPIELVAGAADTLITLNTATTDLLALETTNEIIGGGFRVVCDGTGWAVFLHTNEAQTITLVDSPTAAITGTFLTTPTEAEVVAGTQTIIITLTGENWIATAGFDAQRQAIIDGLTSAGAEAGGWNAKVRDIMAVTTVVRTSDTAVTVTLPATADYSISANETVTVTVPTSALAHDYGSAITGDVAIPIAKVAATVAVTGSFLTTPTESEVVTGSQTIILTLTGSTWQLAAGGAFDATRQSIIDGLTSAGAEAGGWNAKVKAVMAVTTVVRTSDTAVTITLPATADYSTTANETVTVTVPATAVVGMDVAMVGDVTITIVSGS